MDIVVTTAPGVSFDSVPEGLVVCSGNERHTVPAADRVASAFAGIRDQLCSLQELSLSLMNDGGGVTELGQLRGMLTRFVEIGLLEAVVRRDGVLVARLRRKGRLSLASTYPPATTWLSRHVVAVPEKDGLRLDSGVSAGTVWIRSDIAPHVFGVPMESENIDLSSLLWRAGLAVPEREINFQDRMWDPVELLATQIGCESSAGRPYGGTYRFLGEVEPPGVDDPAVTVIERVAYPAPDLSGRVGPSYDQVLQARCSRLDYVDAPVPSLPEVAGILRRTTTIRENIRDDRGLPASRRFVPAGGGVHEVDLYLVVHNVDGLKPGLYRNVPEVEELHRIDCLKDPAELIEYTSTALRLRQLPPFTIMCVARFERLMWKYEGVALSLVLKNAGILTQALYLAAAAQGLGACAQGGASTELFRRVTGLGLPRHAVVGQMAFGPISAR